MAQMYSQNTMPPETRAASDRVHAEAVAAGYSAHKLRRKYVEAGVAPAFHKKSGGNSGNTGRAYRAYMRGHQGGQISSEEKRRREEESRHSRENQKPKYVKPKYARTSE
jgi:hypothetical protein